MELFASASAKKDLELTATIAEGTPARVVGDAARVRQILVNLLGNAVKFTERGEVALTVSARSAPKGGAAEGSLEVVCAVRDTGVGIPADGVRSLFVPFSQVDPSSTRKFGGTGLGLAISQRLARAMGGEIAVESAPGEGSTFTFTFRAEPQGLESVLGPEQPEERAGILCARASTRAMLGSLLRSLPMEPVPWESVEALRASGPDCDVLVCEEGLYDERVREVIAAAGTPVVLLAAQPIAPGAALPPGVVATLSKPVRRSELRRTLLAVLGLHSGESAPTAARLPSAAPKRPVRVLVAEDNPINQRVALLLLERLGHRADVVGNGVEAVEAVSSRPYDLVLMDVRMPEMDGIEATRRIRAEVPRDRQPRVVALTANATVEDREACRKAGMDDFLSKPVRAPDLVRVLNDTKGRPAAQPPSAPQDDPIDHKALDGLRRLFANRAGELRSMMDDYLESADRHLVTIDEALAKSETEAAEMSAHSLKGVSGQMGARNVMAAAYRVEKAAAAGDVAGARELLQALRDAHEAARPLLLDACGDAAPSSETGWQRISGEGEIEGVEPPGSGRKRIQSPAA